ncbi:MAG TPA: PIG-L deacetylase family protein [Methylomirabilota bacterium]|nr:PIG-L deacetylase family protein [Methylomirabilota bacterium]
MFDLGLTPRSEYRVLCLGSHCDDIEIGCGGTILALTQALPRVAIDWVVFSSDEQRECEALESAQAFLTNAAKKNIVIKKFKDGFFPYIGAEIKEYFEQLKQETDPDLVFTHYGHDLHQDHRLISELTWNTFRNHLILEYEVPKYDGDFGSPNLFVPLDESICMRKTDYLLTHFKTQRSKHWFSKDLFLSILRLRGMEANAASRYAEAFYCHKMVLAASLSAGVHHMSQPSVTTVSREWT